MRSRLSFKLLKSFVIAGTGTLLTLVAIPAPAPYAQDLSSPPTDVQAPVTFLRSPRLVSASTTFDGVRMWGATYYFTIDQPADIGQPLARVVIQQRRGFDAIDFYPERTVAFQGTRNDRGESLPFTARWDDESQGTIVQFDPPVAPGTAVTVGLRPIENPDYGGIYLFGVTTYPPSENALGLYLGPGRLSFYDSDSWH